MKGGICLIKSKRVIALFLSLAAILSVFSGGMLSYADEGNPTGEEIIVRYSVISSHSSRITISGIKATCTAHVSACYSTSLKIKMELQKKKSSGYETIKTWTDTRTGYTLGAEHSRAINILSTYRLKTTFTAGNETVVVYNSP